MNQRLHKQCDIKNFQIMVTLSIGICVNCCSHCSDHAFPGTDFDTPGRKYNELCAGKLVQ